VVDLASLGDEPFCYVSTRGRVTGKAHTIEIWFALRNSTIFVLSGTGDRSDWVRNVRADPEVRVRIGAAEFDGLARIVTDPEEDAWARDALVAKYQPGYRGDLTSWKRRSLAVAIDLSPG
jgi:deazaflavin-dependent oxidoreductase (nitroreductase family)